MIAFLRLIIFHMRCRFIIRFHAMPLPDYATPEARLRWQLFIRRWILLRCFLPPLYAMLTHATSFLSSLALDAGQLDITI